MTHWDLTELSLNTLPRSRLFMVHGQVLSASRSFPEIRFRTSPLKLIPILVPYEPRYGGSEAITVGMKLKMLPEKKP